MSIYKVKKTWLYTTAKRNQVPVCRVAGKNYYSRKHMDAVLGTSIDLDAIIDWLSPQEVADRYGINLTAVRSYAHRHKIPSKREFGHTYYSQSHFDELRRTDLISDNRYYTSTQVAEKYGLSKANVGVIAKKHQGSWGQALDPLVYHKEHDVLLLRVMGVGTVSPIMGQVPVPTTLLIP